jgi:hypothetical protein
MITSSRFEDARSQRAARFARAAVYVVSVGTDTSNTYRFTVHVHSRPVKLRAPGGPPDSPATRHTRYGYGAILSQEGSGDETRLTVYFDRAGKKKFVARYADLTPA